MTEATAAETLAARHRYRDELNFAEFPLAAVSDTAPDGVKTLEFTDSVFDPSTGKPVARTLTITAADKFGLPTALDDEVLLGLTQLTCEQGFADRKVHFSRYGLIKLLGWRDESKSYKRIEDSLNRWTGVTLQYRRAWWSKDEQCWVNETFHVLDQVTVFDRERLERRRKMAKGGSPEKALSSFVWNETVFQSFRSGYIKSLDFNFYKSLRSAIAKRMFRFLDKRFYHKGRWEFDLRAFACEHVGLSKNYSNSELKRKLAGAVAELEAGGFLAPLPAGERFASTQAGHWKAVFVKAAGKVAAPPGGEADDPLVADLMARGITRRRALELVGRHARAKVEEKVRLFDWMRGRGGEGAIRNRAGWLYAAVVHDYEVPAEAASAVRPPLVPAASPPPAPAPERVDPRSSGPSPEDAAFDAFWSALSPTEQADYERDAVAAAPPFLQKQYRDGEAGRGTLWRASRERALRARFAATRLAGAE